MGYLWRIPHNVLCGIPRTPAVIISPGHPSVLRGKGGWRNGFLAAARMCAANNWVASSTYTSIMYMWCSLNVCVNLFHFAVVSLDVFWERELLGPTYISDVGK